MASPCGEKLFVKVIYALALASVALAGCSGQGQYAAEDSQSSNRPPLPITHPDPSPQGNFNRTSSEISRDAETLRLDVFANYAVLYGAGEVPGVKLVPANKDQSIRFLARENSSMIEIPFLEPDQQYNLTFGDLNQSWATFKTPRNPSVRLSLEAHIAPGIAVATSAGTCTLGFLARDARNETLYAFTAGHCFAAGQLIGAEAKSNGQVIGRVRAGQAELGADWALIALDEGLEVSPRILALGGPSATSWEPYKLAEEVCYVGHGQVYDLVEINPRCGALLGTRADGFFYFGGTVDVGDSGGPVIEADTGRAMGILTGYLYSPVGYADAFHICAALSAAYNAGFPLRLLTAGPSSAPVAWTGVSDRDPLQQPLAPSCSPAILELQLR